jgi:NADH-quinone oxidoreductase subunit I
MGIDVMNMPLEILRSLAVTFIHTFKRPVTVQYPEERPNLMPRFRGAIRLLRDEDGREKCTGCSTCANVCPVNAISLKAGKDESGKKVATEYTIDFSRCAFCGFCIEVCPVQAIEMTHMFELAEENIEEVRYDKESLLTLLGE